MGYWIYWRMEKEITQEDIDSIKAEYKKLYEINRLRYKYINWDESARVEGQINYDNEYKDKIVIKGSWGGFSLKVGQKGKFTAKSGGEDESDTLMKFILLVASRYVDINIYSDGNRVEDWNKARNLYKRIFEEQIPLKQLKLMFKEEVFFG